MGFAYEYTYQDDDYIGLWTLSMLNTIHQFRVETIPCT